MKLIPSKTQWGKWSLPSKAGYIGACVGLVALVFTILIPIVQMMVTLNHERPIISISSLDSYINKDSLETKFIIKNVGAKPAYIIVKGEASINGEPVEVRNQKFASMSQVIMPEQLIKYRGLVIKGKTYEAILNGKLSTKILQNVQVEYGDTEKSIGKYYVSQTARLDIEKLAKLNRVSKFPDGLWLIEKSSSR